jgi:hypothetical protein
MVLSKVSLGDVAPTDDSRSKLRAEIRAIVDVQPLLGRDHRWSPQMRDAAIQMFLDDLSVLENLGPTEPLKAELLQLSNGTPTLQHSSQALTGGSKRQYVDFYAHMRQLGDLFSFTLLEAVDAHVAGNPALAQALAAVALRIYAEAYLVAGLNLGDRNELFSAAHLYANAVVGVPALAALLTTGTVFHVMGSDLSNPHSALTAGALSLMATVPGLVLKMLTRAQQKYKSPATECPRDDRTCPPYDHEANRNRFPTYLASFQKERVLAETAENGLAKFHKIVERRMSEAAVSGTPYLQEFMTEQVENEDPDEAPRRVLRTGENSRRATLRLLSELADGSLSEIFPTEARCKALLELPLLSSAD